MQSEDKNSLLMVNIGCGATPTSGWTNFDNSMTVRLARHKKIIQLFARTGLMSTSQVQFAEVVRRCDIKWANAVRHIPLPSASAQVVYTSHMVEHLHQSEVVAFLAEVRRLLVPGGVLRLVVPDLLRRATRYLEATRDADEFIRSLGIVDETNRSGVARLLHLLIGARNHRWMYDATSLVRLLERQGFCSVQEVVPGRTSIPQADSLDLREREDESIYVEAVRPHT